MKSQNLKFKSFGLSLMFLIILLGSLLFPLISLAGEYIADGKTIKYSGLVPCGKSTSTLASGESLEVSMPCQFCHFFVLFDGIIDFVLFKIVPPIAVLMLVIAGFMYVGAIFEFIPGGIKTFSQAKSIITSVVLSLVIIFVAWILVTTFFKFIGLSETGPLGELVTDPTKWSQINCEIQLPSAPTPAPAPTPTLAPAPTPTPAPAPFLPGGGESGGGGAGREF